MSGTVVSCVSDLRQRLKCYDVAYADLLDRAVPLLRSGRAIDLEHTVDVLNVLLDFLDSHPDAEVRHDVLIPAALLHDSGWSEVPEEQFRTSYGDVRLDNPGKIEHQRRGAAIARTLLERADWDPEAIEKVAAIIAVHDVPEEYVKDGDATLIAEIDKLIRYMPSLFWALVKDGTMTLEHRIRFLEEGIDKWFSTPEMAERARRLLEDRKRESAGRREQGRRATAKETGERRRR